MKPFRTAMSVVPIPKVPFDARAQLNDLIHTFLTLSDIKAEEGFLECTLELKKWCEKQINLTSEVGKLQPRLLESEAKVVSMEKKLKTAQHMLTMESQKRNTAEQKIQQFMSMFEQINGDKGRRLTNDPTELMSILSSTIEGLSDGRPINNESVVDPRAALSTIDESCDTLDAISDIELTGGDDLDVSSILVHSPERRRSSRKRKSSPSPPHKKQRSYPPSEIKRQKKSTQDTAYTPSAPPMETYPDTPMKRQAPVPPKSMITPQYNTNSPVLRTQNSLSRAQRPHCFYTKSIYMTEHCQPCQKKINFGRSVLKCRDCRAVCHVDCRDQVPLPCVATVTTPNNRNYVGVIADYTPAQSPMVPSLIVHCTNEVEQRGLTEVGIYRVSALEKEIKELKVSFLRGKNMPNISTIDIHIVCGTVKNFLRSFKEPIVTFTLWQAFVNAANMEDPEDCSAALYAAVADLPQPNRDTLAWMMLHLQRVSESSECCMGAPNLCKVFGPTMVGYSVPDPQPATMLSQTIDQQAVMSALLSLSSDYWSSFTLTDENFFSGNLPPEIRTPTHDGKTPKKKRRSLLYRGAL